MMNYSKIYLILRYKQNNDIYVFLFLVFVNFVKVFNYKFCNKKNDRSGQVILIYIALLTM